MVGRGAGSRGGLRVASIVNQAAAVGLTGMDDAHPDRALRDGETLSLLGREIEVALVPGHTPGHIVFIDRQDRLAIVGGTLFRSVIGRTDFAYGDQAALVEGIRTRILTLPDDITVLPGHGLPTTIGEERRTNPFLR